MKYVFYDFETTGISAAFDQPLQFAAIVTDESLNELERIDIRCQVAPHILPSPFALHVTNIKPEQTTNKNLQTPFEFAQTLQAFTEAWAPACWLGYNTIAFDEPMMRQMFYQNLQPNIFATQMNGNTRLDVMKMVFATYAEANSTLAWPTNSNGKLSFKLDQLAPHNGFAHENAHDALADVEATIYIFKKISEGAPDLFEKLLQAADKTFISSSLRGFVPMEITLRFGANAPKTYKGCFCGASKSNPNSIGFVDFGLIEADEFAMASPIAITQAIEASPKIIRNLAVNKSETFRIIENPSEEMLAYCKTVRAATDVQGFVSEALDARFAGEEPIQLEVEDQIYSNFTSQQDKNLLKNFQTASWSERANIINKLSDRRLQQLGKRLVAFYAPQLLTEQQLVDFNNFLNQRWSAAGDEAPWMTAEEVWIALDKLSSDIEVSEWRKFYQARIDAVAN